MNMTKDPTQSHVTGCSDMMFTFVSKEGSNSFPTSVVLLNRFYFSPDEYDWVKNSGISVPLPKFKVGDDIHWYKLNNLYENLKNAVISESIFKDVPIFKDEEFKTPEKSTKAFKSKNAYYIYNDTKKQVYWSPKFDKESFTHYTSASEEIIDPLDVASIDNVDYLLCKNTIYRFKNDNTYSKVYEETDNAFNAFDIGSNKIFVATDNGVKVLEDNGSSLSVKDTIKYKTTVVTVSAPSDGSSSGGSSSGSSSTSVSVPNGIPTSNKCTFVWIAGGTLYAGDNNTSCKFPVNGSYEVVTPSPEQIANPNANYGKKVLGTNKHYDSVNLIEVPTGTEYGTVIYLGMSKVEGIHKTKDLTYLVSEQKITVFLNNKLDKKLTEFNASNGIGGSPKFVEMLNGDIWVLVNSKWKRTMNPKDPEIPFAFILYGFDFNRDSEKEKIDCRIANVTVDEILSLAYSNEVFNKYFANANEGPTTFMTSFSKGSKTILNVFGNDNRQAKAVEMKQCCNAFDIGED